MLQQARNLLMDLDDRGAPGALPDPRPRREVPGAPSTPSSPSESIKVIRTPVQAPNANAHIERWVGSVRRECLDRLLIVGRRQLEHVLRVYVRHYNRTRPHRALDLQPPDPSAPLSRQSDPARAASNLPVSRRDLLGGLIHEYELAAA